MSRTHADDRALAAVRRVREARERDSRIGLQHALTTSAARAAAAEHAARRLAEAPAFTIGSVTAFSGHVGHLARLAAEQAEAAGAAETSRGVAEEATRRWQRDRQAVRTVELLLERRAEQRRVERNRREARDLDDLAAQAWLRGRAGSAGEVAP